jgi:hypothetical protein
MESEIHTWHTLCNSAAPNRAFQSQEVVLLVLRGSASKGINGCETAAHFCYVPWDRGQSAESGPNLLCEPGNF